MGDGFLSGWRMYKGEQLLSRGCKCRYVLSLYVIFLVEYEFVSEFVEGGTFVVEQCVSVKTGTN